MLNNKRINTDTGRSQDHLIKKSLITEFQNHPFQAFLQYTQSNKPFPFSRSYTVWKYLSKNYGIVWTLKDDWLLVKVNWSIIYTHNRELIVGFSLLHTFYIIQVTTHYHYLHHWLPVWSRALHCCGVDQKGSHP